MGIKCAVVDINAFGEVVLWEELISGGGQDRAQESAIIGLVAWYGVGKFAGKVRVAVEERDESSTRVLAWKMGEDNSCDIWVVDELVHEADACVVDDNNSVVALVGNLMMLAVCF